MTALRNDRVNHAYLFSGPRGCGKTTSARILARCLNCAEGPTDTPCGKCPSCVELSRDGGGSLDVVEIDAASRLFGSPAGLARLKAGDDPAAIAQSWSAAEAAWRRLRDWTEAGVWPRLRSLKP